MPSIIMPSPASNNHLWQQRDLAHLWHPCTQMKDHEQMPIVPIKSGQGVWLEDFDGRRYLDAVSSWWVNIFGHRHPYIVAALEDQLQRLEHVLLAGFSHEPAIVLAERLSEITPAGLTRCFYTDNGSSAIEAALKMSFQYWRNQGQTQKKRFITLANSYHGETLGALSMGQLDLYREVFEPLLLEPLTAPSPDCFYRSEGESWRDYSLRQLDAMRVLLETHGHEVCAVLIEPLVQCAGNMRMYHADYLRGLRRLCDEHQVHLIADEIAVGFGRTGTLFACEQADISPDLMCLSKGLTGGFMPLAAVMSTEAIYQAFYDDYENLTAFLHSHSYTGNPLACRAALATLDLFAQQDVLADNLIKSATIRRQCAVLADHPHVAEVRQHGMITAIEMIQDKATRAPYPWQERRGLTVYRHGLQQGVLLRPLGNVVYLMPPYTINDEEISLMVHTACEGIDLATQT